VLTLRDGTTRTGTETLENSGPAVPEAPPPDQLTRQLTVAVNEKLPAGSPAELRR
jgi:hypothetical protein